VLTSVIFTAGEPTRPDIDDSGHCKNNENPTAWHNQSHEQTKVMYRRYLHTSQYHWLISYHIISYHIISYHIISYHLDLLRCAHL